MLLKIIFHATPGALEIRGIIVHGSRAVSMTANGESGKYISGENTTSDVLTVVIYSVLQLSAAAAAAAASR